MATSGTSPMLSARHAFWAMAALCAAALTLIGNLRVTA